MAWYKGTDSLNQTAEVKHNRRLDEDREFLEQVFKERHQEMPAHLQVDEEVLLREADVELTLAESYYLNSFLSLQRDRPQTFGGIAFIPWMVLNTYANEEGLVGIEKDVFMTILSRVDSEVVDYLRAKEDKKK